MMLNFLNDMKKGQKAVIKEFQDIEVAAQSIRIGISPGEMITCITKVPGGPVVLQKNGMELAIGQNICRKILVEIQ